MVRLLPAVVVASLAALCTASAHAATVMIVRPPAPSPELTETVSRLEGELLAVGLVVMIVDRGVSGGPAGASAHAWLEAVARERQANGRTVDGAIDVIGGARLEGVEIWVFPRAPRLPKATRGLVERDVENAPARLALRATDVLESLLIENDLDWASEPPARDAAAGRPPPEKAGVVAVAAPPMLEGPHLGFELGAAMLASLDGVGPAFLPLMRVDASLGRRLGLQVEVAGFGSRPSVGVAADGARVAQQYGLAGACLCPRGGARWRPLVGLAIGGLHTSADGQADPPLQAHVVSAWSFLVQAGAGTRLRLAEHTDLVVAAHLQLAEPYVAVNLAGAGVVTSGRPNLLLSLALGEWL